MMMNHLNLLCVLSFLYGAFIVKYVFDEVKDKKWALNIIISIFCFGLFGLALSKFFLSSCFYFGFALGFATLFIATRFSNLGPVDFMLVAGAFLGAISDLLATLLCAVLFIPLGTVIALSLKRRTLIKNLLILCLIFSLTNFITHQLLLNCNNPLITGTLGGLMAYYGTNYAKKGKEKS